MGDSEQREWWTVPQAAVWIRTRDLTAVEDLGPRTRISLAMASLEMPGVFEAANQVLLPALEAGRLAAWCRDSMGNVEEIPQDSWKNFPKFSEQWKEEEPVGITAGTLILIVVAADRCQSLWSTPANILPKPYPLAHVLANLNPIDHPQWILTHPAVLVTGLNDRGERAPIDQMALVYGERNLNTNTVATTDGRLTWSEVTVELLPQEQAAAQGSPEAPPPQPPTGAPHVNSAEVEAESAPAAPRRAPDSPRKRGVAEKDDSELLAKVRRARVDDPGISLYAAVLRHCGEKTKKGVEAAYKRVNRKIDSGK